MQVFRAQASIPLVDCGRTVTTVLCAGRHHGNPDLRTTAIDAADGGAMEDRGTTLSFWQCGYDRGDGATCHRDRVDATLSENQDAYQYWDLDVPGSSLRVAVNCHT